MLSAQMPHYNAAEQKEAKHKITVALQDQGSEENRVREDENMGFVKGV